MKLTITNTKQLVKYYIGSSFVDIMKNSKGIEPKSGEEITIKPDEEIIIIVVGKVDGAQVTIEYQIVPEIDVFWTSIYAGVGVALLAGCTGLCVLSGVSYIA